MAHRVKNNDAAAIKQMAKEMAEIVPNNAVLVPIPSSTGEATTTLEIAEIIAEIKGLQVKDIIKGDARGKWYDAKKEGKESFDFGFRLIDKAPVNALLIDNVYDTGETIRQALVVLPNAKTAVHSVVGIKKQPKEKQKGTPLSEIKVSIKAQVEETGEFVDIIRPADVELQELDARLNDLKQLRDCIS